MRSHVNLMSIILLPVISTVLSTLAAEPAELPANAWTEVGRNEAGARRGAAVVWLAKEKRFLIAGGLQVNEWTAKAKIPSAPALMTFDPATRQWEEFRLATAATGAKGKGLMLKNDKGELTLNPGTGIAGISAWDPDKRHLYIYGDVGEKTFCIYRLDLDAGKWETLSTARPPTEATGRVSGEFGYGTIFMSGASLAFDPINRELIFVGGRTADHPRGFVGNWAFGVDAKTWRELRQESATLDPLRTQAEAVAGAAHVAENAARNVFFSGLAADKESAAIKGRPAELGNAALKSAEQLGAAIAASKGNGWEAGAVKQASARVTTATEGLKTAAAALAAGQVSAEIIKHIFDAAWSIDEAAGFLQSSPGGREDPGVAFDPDHKTLVVFGGNHGDYLLNDTWIYDCQTRSWRQIFPAVVPQARAAGGNLLWMPGMKRLALAGGETYVPKFIYFQRQMQSLSDVWAFDAATGTWAPVNAGSPGKQAGPPLTCRLAVGDGDVMLGLAHKGRYADQVASYHLMRVAADSSKPEGGTPAGTRTYMTVVKEYDPTWFDGADRGDPKTVDAFLAGLKPNAWTPVPKAPREAAQRDWGTAIFDPDRDQWYHWTGGHMADPSTIMTTYHPGINRWSIPFVGEYLDKGLSFNGRPDCRNHTYLTYAYDPVSKKVACTHIAGTSLYDPDRGEFEPPIEQPFKQHAYVTATISTPKGVVGWHPGYFGLLDATARTWKKLEVKGSMPWPATDGTAAIYDAKRDVIWFAPFTGYQKPAGQVWRYDMKTAAVEAMNPAGMQEIGKGPAFKGSVRETIHLPKVDLVLFNNFAGNRMVVYDPEKNRWALSNITKCPGGLGGVGIGMMYDARRDVIWAQDNGQKMYVLKVDPQSLKLETEATPPAAPPEKK